MISIVTAYYNRKILFKKTLVSISSSECQEAFEVIAIDDGSDDKERLEDLIEEFSFLKVIRLEKKNKWYNNSCIPFNEGFKRAKGDKIIIQNPECYHHGDILKYTSENLTDNQYLSFSCFSLNKEFTENTMEFYDLRQVSELMSDVSNHQRKDGELGWYNHSVYRPLGYHFCAAISKTNLRKLGGFSEMYSLGIGYDDNEFLARVKKLLHVKFIDKLSVLHQYHYNNASYHKKRFAMTLYQINKILFDSEDYNKIDRNKWSLNKSITVKAFIVLPKIVFRLFTLAKFYSMLSKKKILYSKN